MANQNCAGNKRENKIINIIKKIPNAKLLLSGKRKIEQSNRLTTNFSVRVIRIGNKSLEYTYGSTFMGENSVNT